MALSSPVLTSALRQPSWLPFPIVPTSYDSHVSLFFPLSSFSLSYREYYSSNSSTLRRDHHFSRSDGSEYLTYQPQQEAVTVVNTTTHECSVYSLTPDQSSHLFYLPSSSILSLLSSVVGFGWSYEGVTRAARNVSANQWRLDNVTITSSGVLCRYDADESVELCTNSSESQSFSQLVDQTNDLITDQHDHGPQYTYTDVTIDYYVQLQPVDEVDGNVPLRVLVSGRRSDRITSVFHHYFDWLQFKPLDLADLYVDTTSCTVSGFYEPTVPHSIAPGDSPSSHHHHPSGLPKMPNSFTMLVEEHTSLHDTRTNQHTQSASGSMLWTRLNDALESTQYLESSTSYSAKNTTLSSTTLYYNYSSSPPLVWTVNSTNCSVQRVTPVQQQSTGRSGTRLIPRPLQA